MAVIDGNCFLHGYRLSQERVTQCATVLYTFFGLRLMYVGARGEEDKDEEFEEVRWPLGQAKPWGFPHAKLRFRNSME